MDPKKLNSYVGVVNQPPPKWSSVKKWLLHINYAPGYGARLPPRAAAEAGLPAVLPLRWLSLPCPRFPLLGRRGGLHAHQSKKTERKGVGA